MTQASRKGGESESSALCGLGVRPCGPAQPLPSDQSHLPPSTMSSGYHISPGTYETALMEPPAKRLAPPGDLATPRALSGDDASAKALHYPPTAPNGVVRDPLSANSNSTSFAIPNRQHSREFTQPTEPVSYSYAIPTGPGATTANTPFALLQHPAFADPTPRDISSDANGNGRGKPEESAHPAFVHPGNSNPQGGNGQSHNVESNERALGPTELLPPGAFASDAPMPSAHVNFTQLHLSGHQYPSYAVPTQYSQYPGAMYGAAGHLMGVSGVSSQTMADGSGGVPGQPQFALPMRRPDFAAANRMAMPQRRHSIAVANPSHFPVAWPPGQEMPHEWPGSSRSSFATADDMSSNAGGDDGSDSDGGDSATVMTSIRPKDMPPGGPVIEGKYITLLVGPGEHQVKDFNILPINILRINYESKSSDYIVVHLICDLKMKRAQRDIFMTAVSAHHQMHDNKRAVLPALKISQQMLRGRTKGFLFQLRYTLVIDGHEVESLHCEPFYLWSNVSQRSFPRHEREAYAAETQDINTKKRRRR